VPVVFEKLASQLKDPPFRTSESGYDPDDVRFFLDDVGARLERLESMVEKAEARANAAERKLKGARRFARAGATIGTDPGVLNEVVHAGGRRAEEVVASAAVEAARLRQDAEARLAAAQAVMDDPEPELRAAVDEQRAALRVAMTASHGVQDDLEAVQEAVLAGRHEILSGLEQHMRELKEARA
jgi:cell division septum initiation protein DivIVA